MLYNQSLIKLPAKCTWWVSGKLKIMEILANSWRQSNERRKKPTKHSHNYCKHPINFSFTVWGTDQPMPPPKKTQKTTTKKNILRLFRGSSNSIWATWVTYLNWKHIDLLNLLDHGMVWYHLSFLFVNRLFCSFLIIFTFFQKLEWMNAELKGKSCSSPSLVINRSVTLLGD